VIAARVRHLRTGAGPSLFSRWATVPWPWWLAPASAPPPPWPPRQR